MALPKWYLDRAFGENKEKDKLFKILTGATIQDIVISENIKNNESLRLKIKDKWYKLMVDASDGCVTVRGMKEISSWYKTEV